MPVRGSYVSLIPRTSAPSAAEGRIYYNSSDKAIYYYDGSIWNKLKETLKATVLEYSTPGSYSVTMEHDGFVSFVIAGGGGGGGGYHSYYQSSGGGGGAGATIIGKIFLVAGDTIEVVVGSGGAGVSSGAGSAGEDSTLTLNGRVTFIAGGGGGGGGGGYGGGSGGSGGTATIPTGWEGSVYYSNGGDGGAGANREGNASSGSSDSLGLRPGGAAGGYMRGGGGGSSYLAVGATGGPNNGTKGSGGGGSSYIGTTTGGNGGDGYCKIVIIG